VFFRRRQKSRHFFGQRPYRPRRGKATVFFRINFRPHAETVDITLPRIKTGPGVFFAQTVFVRAAYMHRNNITAGSQGNAGGSLSENCLA